ncbi:GIY-YIG nuclease family protein [Nanoarchaeota archaeon]
MNAKANEIQREKIDWIDLLVSMEIVPLGDRLLDRGKGFYESLKLDKPGVYVFFDSKGNALYVGMSYSLEQRLETHRVTTEKRMYPLPHKLMIEFNLYPEKRERELIQKLNPKYNGTGITVHSW